MVWLISMGVLIMQHDLGTSLMFFAMFVAMPTAMPEPP